MSSMYEKIIEVLEKKGPTNFSSILDELSYEYKNVEVEHKQVQLSAIKSVITRKKDIFHVNDNIVSILPEKEINTLTLEFMKQDGNWYKLKFDFLHEGFFLYEWNNSKSTSTFAKTITIRPFSYVDLIKEIYKCKIWNWNNDHLVVEDELFSIQLKTTKSFYQYKGKDFKEKEWKQIKKVLSSIIELDALMK